jgi:TonB-linked SusC/RagA family outer membrane protein
MEKMLPSRQWLFNGLSIALRALGIVLVLELPFAGAAWAQNIGVAGTVTSTAGNPLRGVTVRVRGTEISTLTDADGRYRISAPREGALSYSLIGQRAVTEEINGRTIIDVTMEPIAFLDEVVVTAYTEQRRADITGAVASMNVEAANRETAASVLKKLDATVPGITVATSGSPGSRSTVRIRGISSFQNNDPLYIVDGTPVQESYMNFLNPNDITSVQVLKDASAASIYGARASNGVIVIETTKRGISGPPQFRVSVRTGMSQPTRGYDDFLITDALDYHEIVRRSYVNAGEPVPTNIYGDPNNPQVPAYIWPNNCTPNPCSGLDESNYNYENGPRLMMRGSPGTNWWKAVFGTGFVGDYNLDISGGGAENAYGVSVNYFNQEGTAAYNEYKRGSARINTNFTRGRFNFGENVALAVDRHFGGITDDAMGEGGIIGKNILMQPVVPVYDVGGNFASGKAVGLGNNTNPLKSAFSARDNVTHNNRLFGNFFGGFTVTEDITLRSRLGFNLWQGGTSGFNPVTLENAEPTSINSIFENENRATDWTWSNTATFNRSFFERSNLNVLVGQEANAITSRSIGASMANLINDELDSRYIQDALGDAASKNVSSSGGRSALLSFFGRAEYNWDEKYVASFTLRKDGSSRLGPSHRWGTFPAFGLGWRLSNEPFMANNNLFSDVMLRFGWGVTGNQLIPSGRTVSQFGGSRGDTYYPVGGGNSLQAGFRQTSLGNPDLKWEENTSVNVGADVSMLNGRYYVNFDVYKRSTDNLLFNPPLPATAGIASVSGQPIVNIGKMENKGWDMAVGHRANSWNVTLNTSAYRNKIVRIDGVQDFFYGPITTRFGNQVINQIGNPIGSFYGYLTDGYFASPAEAGQYLRPSPGAACAVYCQDGAGQGRIRFKDLNGDGTITAEDRTIIGSPHPDFTAGLDFSVRRGNFDLSATIFGSFGNEIFDVQKEFYVFRNFSTNVRRDLLTDSWDPANPDPNAKYPILDFEDTYSRQLSDFYVEDGSYVRMRNIQLGYNVPARLTRFTQASRIYIQAENLFTITGYDGLDPALPAQAVSNSAGDIRDQYRGVDRGVYPSNRIFSIGLTTQF